MGGPGSIVSENRAALKVYHGNQLGPSDGRSCRVGELMRPADWADNYAKMRLFLSWHQLLRLGNLKINIITKSRNLPRYACPT